MYHILVSGFKAFKEMTCKSIRKIRFSNGGHIFAVAMASSISIFKTYDSTNKGTFQIVTELSGHVGPVQSLSWSNDSYLFSTGMDGNVYGWDLRQNSRIDGLNVLKKSSSYVSLIVNCTDNNPPSFDAITCSSDGFLHTISWSGDKKDIATTDPLISDENLDQITAICLGHDKEYIFTGSSGGYIRCYKNHIGKGTLCYELPLHSPVSSDNQDKQLQGVTNIKCTNKYVICTGGDSSIFILKIKPPKQSDTSEDKDIFDREEHDEIVLISADEFEDGKRRVSELNEKIQSLKGDHEFAIHSKDKLWQGEMKELSEKTNELIKAER